MNWLTSRGSLRDLGGASPGRGAGRTTFPGRPGPPPPPALGPRSSGGRAPVHSLFPSLATPTARSSAVGRQARRRPGHLASGTSPSRAPEQPPRLQVLPGERVIDPRGPAPSPPPPAAAAAAHPGVRFPLSPPRRPGHTGLADWLAARAGSQHVLSARLLGDLGASLATAPLALRRSSAKAQRPAALRPFSAAPRSAPETGKGRSSGRLGGSGQPGAGVPVLVPQRGETSLPPTPPGGPGLPGTDRRLWAPDPGLPGCAALAGVVGDAPSLRAVEGVTPIVAEITAGCCPSVSGTQGSFCS